MLPLPPGEEPLRIVSLDPGSDTFGAALLEIDLCSRQVGLAEVHLFRGVQLQRTFALASRTHNDLFAKILGHEENLLGYLHYAQPHVIISEAPYMGRFPAAFGALTGVMQAIRRAVWRYDPYMPLRLVEPSPVKKFMGVKGTSGDKTAMTRALMKRTDLINRANVDLSLLDEHGIDATCIGLYQARAIIDNLPI
jgi:hypothetical protein